MKVLLRGQDVLCVVVEDDGDSLLLEPVDGDEDQWFWVELSDPRLVIDPTDADLT